MAEALTALAGLATIVQMAVAAGMKAKSHKHNVQALVRRLKLIPPLIEEVRASRTPLTESQLNVFENLELAMQRAKDLLTKCSENSKLYMIFRGDSIVQKFRDVGLDLDRCLSALSFVQLKVSDGTLEKIEEVSVALREAKFKVDVVDQNLSLKIAEALKEQRDAQRVNEELLRSLATQLDLTTVQASRAEEKGLLRDREEARAEKERGEEAYINQIIHLLDTLELGEASHHKRSPSRSLASPPQPPDEFRCPVSLELMADPVILDSGHTFERAYIQKWLDDGHRTCPISRKPLTTLKLIPNQTLKGMIITWCEGNHVALPKVPVLKMEAPAGDIGRSVLEGFKGLRFGSDHSGSSAEWEEYEMTSGRGVKKRRGVSKFEEEMQRSGGRRNALADLVSKPRRRSSKVEELVRGVEVTPQQLMLYNVTTEEQSEGEAIAEGLAFGGPPGAQPSGQGLGFGAPNEGAPGSNPNSGQLSDGFGALENLYDSGSLKFDGPDTYSEFDIRDIMCESPLRPRDPGDDVSIPPAAGFDDVSISPVGHFDDFSTPRFDDVSISPPAGFDDVSISSVARFDDVSGSGGGLLGFEPGDRGFGVASTSQTEGPNFRLSWERRSPERDAERAAEIRSNEHRTAVRRGAQSTAGLRLVGLQEDGYQPSRLRPSDRGVEARSIDDVLRTMSGGEHSREKRSLPAEFQLGITPDTTYRHGQREHLRPLARGGPGGRRGVVNRGDVTGQVSANRAGESLGLDEGDFGHRGFAGKLTGSRADDVGVNGVSVNGVGLDGVGLLGLGVNRAGEKGVNVNGVGLTGVGGTGVGLDGVGVNGVGLHGVGLAGVGVNRSGGNGRHRPTAQSDGIVGNAKPREGTIRQPILHRYDWETNVQIPSSFTERTEPAQLARSTPKSPVGTGVGIYRGSSDPAKHEGRLEGAPVHRRGASLPKDTVAGRSPPLRSPRSPAISPILDDFLLDAPAEVGVRTPLEFGHRVTAPQPDVRGAGHKEPAAERAVPAEKPKPYLTTPEEVTRLLEALEGDDIATKRDAAEMLRTLGKNSNANRATIAAAGAIPLLLGLIDSSDAKLQEHAITAILNLSIHDVNKTALTVAGAIPALVEVLANPWSLAGAKESAAATLFSLSVMDDCKVTIGDAGAIPHLVDLLRNGSARGQKDAVTALFNLSIFSGNKVRIIKAKAVPLLIALVRDHSVREKCVAVLANLSTMKEGRVKIADAGGIPVLVDQVEVGTPRSKENAAATLLQMGVNSSRYVGAMIQAGAISRLLALSQNGTPRAKEKAVALIRQFRDQRKTESVRAHVGEQTGGSLYIGNMVQSGG